MVVSALAWGAAAAPARAEVSIRWQAPAECGEVAALRAKVARDLGRPLAASDAVAVTVVASERPDGRYDGLIHFVGEGGGRRVVVGKNCAAVTDAVALVLAVVILDDADRVAPPPKPAATPRRDAPAAEVSIARSAAARHPRRLHVAAGAEVLAGAGALPGEDLGGAASLSAALAGWRARVGFALWRRGTASLSGDPMATVAIGLWAVRLRGCRDLRWLSVCAGGEIGRMAGAGSGYAGAAAGAQGWYAATAAAMARYRIAAAITLVATAEGVVPISAPRFVNGNGTELHQPATVVGRLGLGVMVGL